MLDFLRRNSRSMAVKIVLGIISIVFVFFLGGGGQIGSSPRAVATVGDQEITAETLDEAIRRNEQFYRQQYGDRLTPELLRALNIPDSTLSQLVDGTLLRQEAESLGLLVPDEALRLEIREIPAFQREGLFSPATYRAALERQGIGAPRFEDELREQLLIEQLVDVVRRGVHVTEEEAFEEFRRAGDELTLEYVKLSAADFEEAVELDDTALKAWFDERTEEYREPERIRVRYLEYDPVAFADESAVTTDQIEEYYALNADLDFTVEETVAARHILKSVAPDADDTTKQQARDAIEAAAKRIADGESFEEVAREASDDTSAESGGDLGTFARGRMVEPFEDAAFALSKDEVSGIVESPFGFHIIQVYEKTTGRVKPLDEVRAEIVTKLATSGADAAAFDAAAADARSIHDGGTLDAVAADREATVKSTAPFANGETVAEVQTSRAFGDTAFTLAEIGATTGAFKVGTVYYVAELQERIDSRIPDIDAVREEVEADYRAAEAGELARAAAEAVLGRLQTASPDGIADALGDREFVETRGFTRRGNFIPGIGSISGLKEVGFRATSDGELLPRVFTENGNAYVFRRKSLTSVAREDFDARKDELIADLRREREQQVLGTFLQERRAKTEIAYNQAMLEQFFK